MRWDTVCLLKSLSQEIACHALRRAQLNKTKDRKKGGNSPSRNGPQREEMFTNQIVSFLVAAFCSIMGTSFTEIGMICQNIFTHKKTEIHRQMVRDRGRHSLQAGGTNFPLLREQEVKKTKRGRKGEKNKTKQRKVAIRKRTRSHSEQGPCIPNSSDISLNSKMNYFIVGLFIRASCHPIY